MTVPGLFVIGGPETEGRRVKSSRQYLLWASSAFEGERRELANRLGISERTLYRRLSEL